MDYIDQLADARWLQKRKEILIRDNNKCQKCYNLNYQDSFEQGIILKFDYDNSNKDISDFDNPNSYRLRIWDLKNNTLETVDLKNSEFDKSESYIAYYDKNKYANLIALRKITANQVEKMSILNVAKVGGIRGIVSDFTFAEVYKTIRENDEWFYIIGLHIHHLCYQDGKLAWEYDQSKLQTLCWTCHESLHEEKTIPVLDINGNLKGSYSNCFRCHGAGYFPEFKHVQSGICFRCSGKRFEELI